MTTATADKPAVKAPEAKIDRPKLPVDFDVMGLTADVDERGPDLAILLNFHPRWRTRADSGAFWAERRSAAYASLREYARDWQEGNPQIQGLRRLEARLKEIRAAAARLDESISRWQTEAVAHVRDGTDSTKTAKRLESARGERAALVSQVEPLEAEIRNTAAAVQKEYREALAVFHTNLLNLKTCQAELKQLFIERDALPAVAAFVMDYIELLHLKRFDVRMLALPPAGA